MKSMQVIFYNKYMLVVYVQCTMYTVLCTLYTVQPYHAGNLVIPWRMVSIKLIDLIVFLFYAKMNNSHRFVMENRNLQGKGAR